MAFEKRTRKVMEGIDEERDVTAAGSLPSPQLHREAKGFKHLLQGSTERNLPRGRTFWLSFMLCLAAIGR